MKDREARTAIKEGRYDDGTIAIDHARMLAWFRGRLLELTPIEYQIVCTFVKHRGVPLTKSFLAQSVWGLGWYADNYVKWHILRIRKAFGVKAGSQEDPIINRMGYGYVYEPSKAPSGLCCSYCEVSA